MWQKSPARDGIHVAVVKMSIFANLAFYVGSQITPLEFWIHHCLQYKMHRYVYLDTTSRHRPLIVEEIRHKIDLDCNGPRRSVPSFWFYQSVLR